MKVDFVFDSDFISYLQALRYLENILIRVLSPVSPSPQTVKARQGFKCINAVMH